MRKVHEVDFQKVYMWAIQWMRQKHHCLILPDPIVDVGRKGSWAVKFQSPPNSLVLFDGCGNLMELTGPQLHNQKRLVLGLECKSFRRVTDSTGTRWIEWK